MSNIIGKPMGEFIEYFVVPIFFAIVLIFNVFIGVYFFQKNSCYQQFKNYNPSYGLIQGCMIDYKGQHIPSDNMRVM